MTDGGLVGLRRQLGHRGGSGSHERCRHDGMQRGETRRRMPGKGGGIFRINDEDQNKIYNENTREYANAIAILRSALRIQLPDGAASWITKEQIQQEKGLPPLPLVSSRAPFIPQRPHRELPRPLPGHRFCLDRAPPPKLYVIGCQLSVTPVHHRVTTSH